MRGAIVVMAKRPEPGRVKTRMSPPLSADQAAELYTAILADVLHVTVHAARRLGLDPVLAVTPAGAGAGMARLAPPGYRVVDQRGPDLSARMAWAVAEQAAAGHAPILLRGSDSPTLDYATLAGAVAGLEQHDLVLCPDRDGGYNLVGLREPAPGLFAHPMSTASVLEDTLARARERSLRSLLLEPRFDLDEVGDLRRLAEARAAGQGALCPRTLAYLDRAELWSAGDGGPA